MGKMEEFEIKQAKIEVKIHKPNYMDIQRDALSIHGPAIRTEKGVLLSDIQIMEKSTC